MSFGGEMEATYPNRPPKGAELGVGLKVPLE
jgi:hypothetical protein